MSRLAFALALCLPLSAFAQFPFPLGQPAPEKPAAPPPTEKGDEPGPQEDKVYTKPEPRPPFEGEPRVLSGPIGVVVFSGIVNPGMAEVVIDAIDKAPQRGHQAVLIELDTPGGLVTSTQKIVQSILGSKVPVIVHVTPSGAHAASAGTFITLAAHVAVMSPATRIGAAHPVTGGGKDPEAEGGKHMGRKVENDLVAMVEGVATERNRNVEWARDAVRDSVSATAKRAEEIGVIDLIARDRAELFERLEGRVVALAGETVQLHTKDATVEIVEPSIRSRLLNLLANPGIAMILGVLGLIGIMIEIYHPGLIVPGVMGVLAMLCSLIAMEQLPIDVGAVILIVAGAGLLIAETFTPTYGALGILGAIGLTIGSLLLIDTGDPDFKLDPSFRLGFADVLPIVALLVAFVAYLSLFVVRTRRGRPTTGSEGLVGAQGRVLKAVGPEGGMVFVAGEYWQAHSHESIQANEDIEVVKVDGLRLEVRRKG